jgi:hypothetical protein
MRKGRKDYILCDLCEFLALFALKFWINYPSTEAILSAL